MIQIAYSAFCWPFQVNYIGIIPNDRGLFPVFTVVSVYVNAVLGLLSLNAREVRHGKGLNEEESFSTERKPTAAAGLPSGILVNHVDTRTTQRNITFLSRHPDIESSGSEMESRMTYQDASGTESVHDKASLSSVPKHRALALFPSAIVNRTVTRTSASFLASEKRRRRSLVMHIRL
ncbi:hypothetical protein BU15DRAFT_66699 [Melanogaster broomeanus]|nr:hypothetical protein BU15DRAFT_66699 [Melanogaster broomeanus]